MSVSTESATSVNTLISGSSDEDSTAVIPITAEESSFPGATPAEQKVIDEYKASEERVVELAIATLDNKDMLKKYAKLGHEALKLANKRKASLKAGSWVKGDFDRVCNDLELLVKMRVPIKDIRIGTYVRLHLWLEAIKVLVPNAEKLSYYQASHKFLFTLAFDPIELTGKLRDGWIEWTRQAIEEQLGDTPMSMRELDTAIENQKLELKKADVSRKGQDADKALEAEKRAAEAKKRSERRNAQSKVAESLDKAIADGNANEKDVQEIVSKVLADHNLQLPPTVSGFDPATATIESVKTLAQSLFKAGKLAEMRTLRDTLDVMIKAAEKALAAVKDAA